MLLQVEESQHFIYLFILNFHIIKTDMLNTIYSPGAAETLQMGLQISYFDNCIKKKMLWNNWHTQTRLVLNYLKNRNFIVKSLICKKSIAMVASYAHIT